MTIQFLCENRKSCYVCRVVGKEGASCEAPDGKKEGEERIYLERP